MLTIFNIEGEHLFQNEFSEAPMTKMTFTSYEHKDYKYKAKKMVK